MMEERDLLILRLEEQKRLGLLSTIYTMGREYTPDDIINEAKAGTPVGNEFLLAEKKFMDYLKQKGGL